MISSSCRTWWGGYLLRGSMAVDPAFRSISTTPVRFGRQSWSASRRRISRPCRSPYTWCLHFSESGLRLSVPGAARRRVDRGPYPGPQERAPGRPAVGSSWCWEVCHPTLFAGAPAEWRSRHLDWPPLCRRVRLPAHRLRVMALIGLACFGVTVASVTRQRRGDAQAADRSDSRRADGGSGSSTCSVSRVPPRLRRGLKCGWT